MRLPALLLKQAAASEGLAPVHYLSLHGPGADLRTCFASLLAERPAEWVKEEIGAKLLAAIGVTPQEHLLVRSPRIGTRTFQLTFVLTTIEVAFVSLIPVEARYERDLSVDEAKLVVETWLEAWGAPVLEGFPSLEVRRRLH